MPAPKTLQNLAPAAFVREATELDLRAFLKRHGDAPLLLVRLPEDDTEIELGLKANLALRGLEEALTSGTGRPADSKPFPFRTTLTFRVVTNESRGWQESVGDEPVSLLQLIDKNPYFAVSMRKRETSDALFMGRISVGRAQNKDIVLRHSSVSKFHAWFEVDQTDCVYVSDAGSMNRTRINGRLIEPRTPTAVAPGDAIQFGAVVTVLCSPETLWTCLNAKDAGGSPAT
jgi:hypothetical protein